MSKLSPILLSVLSILAMVLASVAVYPAFAQSSSSSSSSSSSISSSSSSSSLPPPPPPPEDKGGTAGGPTDFNLARESRDNPTMLVGCRGTSQAPDLFFRNIGNTAIPAGTSITWIVPSTGERGTFATPKEIKPGDYVPYPAALAAALGKDGTCVAGLLG